MNFYKRFIGDIQAKTGGLTLAEFGAYDRLLDHYYSTEKPVPADEVYRICRAMSPGERTAVDKVLRKFFETGADGYTQSKADEVIAKALPLIEAARANGKKGGRPKKPAPEKTQPVSKNNPAETQEEPSSKATQSQSQITPSDEGVGARKRAVCPTRPDDVSEAVWRDWLALRKEKKAAVSETVLAGARREAQKASLPLERFLEIWCTRGSMGLQADWLRATERGQSGAVNGNKNAGAAAAIFGSNQPSRGEVIDV